MRSLYKYMQVIVVVLFLTACQKSFLDTTPQQSTDISQVATDLPSTRGAVNGIYSLLKSASYYGRALYVLADLMSDNAYISRKNSGRYLPYDQYGVISNDGTAAGLWNQLYSVIANANILISRAEQLTLPASQEAERKYIVDEAYCLRALAYFDLVRLFAQPYAYSSDASHPGVPVVTTTTPDNSSLITPARNTVKQVYDQIIADLQKAVGEMPTTPVGFTAATKGRISLYAAKALLSRVYLYKGDWAGAEAQATDVIAANQYTLLSRDNLVSGFSAENNSETIFEVIYLTNDNLGTDAMVNFCIQGGSYGDLLGTDTLYNFYQSTDARRGFISRGKRTGSGGENPATLINKYTNNTTYMEGMKVIRLAEVYLTRAEARSMQGKDGQAAQDVDVILKRAFVNPAPTTATGPALLTIIKNERRRELFLEGHRLFDLTRWQQSFTKYRTGGLTIPIAEPNNKTILPIPLAEMNVNSNMAQNQGYN